MNKSKDVLRLIYNYFIEYQTKFFFVWRLSRYKQKGLPLKILIGSSKIYDKGWISSDKYILDLLDEHTWKKYFEENEIESLLAEHVWEHLTEEQGICAAKICYKYLKRGGYIRLAVPDGFHCQEEYIDHVKPNGYGAGSDNHKLLYNYKSFSSVFREAGFEIELLEYFDEKHEFHSNEWVTNMGKIYRSIKYDKRNINGKPNYTSIIIDARKI